MKLYIYKSGFALFPAFTADMDLLGKMKEGEIWETDIKKARNPMFHRKFFALLKMGFENQNSFNAPEWWREWVTMKAGWFESCKAPNGETMYRAKSIAFDKMDDFEFSELYKAVSQVTIDVCKITEKQIEENLNLFL